MRLYTNYEMEMLIDNYIHSEKHRAILKRRLIDGVKFDDLADEFNYSARHIKRIVYKAENELLKHLE